MSTKKKSPSTRLNCLNVEASEQLLNKTENTKDNQTNFHTLRQEQYYFRLHLPLKMSIPLILFRIIHNLKVQCSVSSSSSSSSSPNVACGYGMPVNPLAIEWVRKPPPLVELVELSKAQDVEAGDGTTSVVVLAGSFLEAAQKLLEKGIHPTVISESFQKASVKAVEILEAMATPMKLEDRHSLLMSGHHFTWIKSCISTLCTDIRVIEKLGGTVDDTELVEGLVLDERSAGSGGPSRMEKAKIGLIQFCISPPKTDTDNQVVVSDCNAMDRVLREERAYILSQAITNH
ncbi:hypothetical protein DAPPUDRAFT_269671 [Daphnia pulex]|uniref:T-complex protein 1 subunit delta n=1 Tax=Daphnia pulex TaxID=6669 RepID=E9HZL7_DAPPU|nr:hypothetical protein DAPPUDRAFT_269671 [Daphnia pulex]|eukprot:EFX62813.1 hypothetical protein DAPPUDRAFT_269671 [Daphnia pulex]